jgi:Tfp pilus assembly protein PilO
MKSSIPIIIVVLSFGLFYVYISPKYNDIKNLRAQQAQYQQTLDRTKALQDVRDGLIKKLNDIKPEQQERLKRFLPENVDTVRLVMDMDALAKSRGLTIRNVKVDNTEKQQNTGGVVIPQAPKAYETVTVSFSFTASYDQMIGLLTALEGSLRLLDVTNLSFGAGSTTNGLYSFDLTLKTYWLGN